jgi:hypothetical protein
MYEAITSPIDTIAAVDLPAGARYWSDRNTAASWDAEGCDACGDPAVLVAEVTDCERDGAGTERSTDDRRDRWVTACPDHANAIVTGLVDHPGDYPDGHGVEVQVWYPWVMLSALGSPAVFDAFATHGIGTGGWL